MDTAEIFARLGTTLGLGLLVGLQRERAGSGIAGIRTFALIALIGGVAGLLSLDLGGWVIAAGLVGVAALALIGNLQRDPTHPPGGVTTEAAMLLVFCVGVAALRANLGIAVAVGAACAVLLHLKEPLHGFVRGLSERDVRAIMVFAAISLVVLPVVPDRTMGPLGVLNPHHLWLMVVLVVGISLAGYVAYRVLGSRRGTAVAALLGGLVSSTATTAAFARRARSEGGPDAAGIATAAVLLSSLVVYARVMVEIYVVSPALFEHLWPPIAALMGLATLCASAALFASRRHSADLGDIKNPTELKGALFFAGLYALVLLATAAAQRWVGDAGVYAVAGVSGLTDMDAITLSTAAMARDGTLEAGQTGTAILIALIANTAFKTALAGTLGGRELLHRLIPYAFITAAGASAVIAWWMPGLGARPTE